MTITIKNVVCAIALLFTTLAYGQEMKVTGHVVDSTGVKPVKYAMVMGVRMKDSLLLGFTRTDQNGDFVLTGFEVDTFTLVIDHPDYDDKMYYMFGHKDNHDINIPSIRMSDKSQELEEVVIYANREPIFYRGDTLIYVADSFKVADGAVVEDLLKKLPGISVDKDGKITSQGQEISQVLVDGDEFFGTDPTVATKNLGADGIEQVKVYEKENEDGIGGDDEKIQVLDLKLKADAKKGYFGRIAAGSDFTTTPLNSSIGSSAFYEGELLLNYFKGSTKLSIFALGSNTPRSSFGWGDLNKFGLENEQGSGNRWNPNGGGSNTSGIPQTLKAGFYYSDKWGKKKQTKFGFNYSYYNDRLDARSASRSQYILSDTTYYTDDSTRTLTTNESHRFNINFETKLDSLTTLQIKPKLSIDKGLTDDTKISKFYGEDYFQSLGTNVNNRDDSKGITAGGFARINRKFMKKKRELELRYDLDYTNNQTDGSWNSRTQVFGTYAYDTTLYQTRNNDNGTQNHYGTLTYVEPIGKHFKTKFEYLFQYGFSTKDKVTYDTDSLVTYKTENAYYSNIFDNTKYQHRGGFELTYEIKSHTISAGVKVRNIDIDNLNKITDTTIHQNITNILPQFEYTFRPSPSKRFRLEYRTSSAQPSINDLAPVPDNSNPNRVKVGNPDLQPSYVHNVSAFFNTWKALTGQYLWAGANFTYTQNAFSTETIYNNYGQAQNKTVNVDGNVMAFLYSGAGFPFLGRKIELTPGINGSFIRTNSYINTDRNMTDNYTITPNLNLDFNLLGDSLEFGFNASYSLNNAISSLNNTSNTYTIETYGADFEWRLPYGFRFGFEGTYTHNSQPGNGFYNYEYFVFNAEIAKKFLKTGNLELAIKGNDIFNQNINARREVNGNIITDYRTTIISRYFLLKLTWRFNNRHTKEEDNYGWH